VKSKRTRQRRRSHGKYRAPLEIYVASLNQVVEDVPVGNASNVSCRHAPSPHTLSLGRSGSTARSRNALRGISLNFLFVRGSIAIITVITIIANCTGDQRVYHGVNARFVR
jgi:hypothetical protein